MSEPNSKFPKVSGIIQHFRADEGVRIDPYTGDVIMWKCKQHNAVGNTEMGCPVCVQPCYAVSDEGLNGKSYKNMPEKKKAEIVSHAVKGANEDQKKLVEELEEKQGMIIEPGCYSPCHNKQLPHPKRHCEHCIDFTPSPDAKEEKVILDACCGGRQFWFNKENPHVLFADQRVMPPRIVGTGKDARVRKCLPDKVMDFRNMDIDSETYKLVVFDPPHLFLGENSYMAQSYGALNKQTWKEDLRKGFAECFRVLKNEGVLIFKWNESDVPLKEVLNLTPYKPLFGHPSGKAQKTHWICFMKFN